MKLIKARSRRAPAPKYSGKRAPAILAKAYRVLEMNDLADDALRVLEYNYPNHPGIYEVREVEIVN